MEIADGSRPDPESLLELVIASLPVVVFAFDSNGIVLVSEGDALTAMGSAGSAAVGHSVFDVFAGEDEVHDHLRRALAGEAHVADLHLGRNDRSYRVWYRPKQDAAGQVAMVMGLSLDVTEASQLDRELMTAVKWLETIQENLPVGLFWVDSAGLITLARGSILSKPGREPVGLPFAEVYPHLPELVRQVGRAQRGHDQTFSMSDGARDFDLFLRAVRDRGLRHGVIGIIVEVTEQRRAASAVLESNWRTRFVAELNHELRTPLNSILGFAELLARPDWDSSTDRQRRYIGNIVASARDLLGLVNELLDVSKLRAGHVNVARERVDSAALLREVAERMAPMAESKQIALQLGRLSPRPALGDARRIRQVVLNLVSNAIKFTPAGGRILLKSHQRHGILTLGVLDTGVGIARRDQDLIFEDYVQAGPGRTTGVGSGLGLALSRRLVRAMGGELSFRSSVGRGSLFEVALPLWTADGQPAG